MSHPHILKFFLIAAICINLFVEAFPPNSNGCPRYDPNLESACSRVYSEYKGAQTIGDFVKLQMPMKQYVVYCNCYGYAIGNEKEKVSLQPDFRATKFFGYVLIVL